MKQQTIAEAAAGGGGLAVSLAHCAYFGFSLKGLTSSNRCGPWTKGIGSRNVGNPPGALSSGPPLEASISSQPLMKTQCEGVLSINGGTQYGAVGGSQWMLALKLEPLLCVANLQESESTVLAPIYSQPRPRCATTREPRIKNPAQPKQIARGSN